MNSAERRASLGMGCVGLAVPSNARRSGSWRVASWSAVARKPSTALVFRCDGGLAWPFQSGRGLPRSTLRPKNGAISPMVGVRRRRVGKIVKRRAVRQERCPDAQVAAAQDGVTLAARAGQPKSKGSVRQPGWIHKPRIRGRIKINLIIPAGHEHRRLVTRINKTAAHKQIVAQERQGGGGRSPRTRRQPATQGPSGECIR